MDTAQWPQQEIVVKPMEEIVVTHTCNNTKPLPPPAAAAVERKPRPQKEQALNCPRCNSTNTKFCYYNNYSLTQPRYFCKTCRRYWTEGGSLRNIPVGGGSRKNRRSISSATSNNNTSSSLINSSKNLRLPDLIPPPSCSQSSTAHHHHHQIPNIHDQGQDLNLGFPATQDFRSISHFLQVPNIEDASSNKGSHHNHNNPSSNNATSSPASTSQQQHHLSALELLTGFTSRGLNSFIPMPIPDHGTVYSSGYPMQDFKPTLNFNLDGSVGNGYGSSLQGGDAQDGNSRRPAFPFEDLKQVPSSGGDVEHSREPADSTGYWTGVIGGGSW